MDDFWTNGIYNIHCTHEYINCARRQKMNSVSLGENAMDITIIVTCN